MNNKYELKYYPGDRVWIVATDPDNHHYALRQVVLSVELWPIEGVIYNLVYESEVEGKDGFALLEADRFIGAFHCAGDIYADEKEAEKVAREKDANRG